MKPGGLMRRAAHGRFGSVPLQVRCFTSGRVDPEPMAVATNQISRFESQLPAKSAVLPALAALLLATVSNLSAGQVTDEVPSIFEAGIDGLVESGSGYDVATGSVRREVLDLQQPSIPGLRPLEVRRYIATVSGPSGTAAIVSQRLSHEWSLRYSYLVAYDDHHFKFRSPDGRIIVATKSGDSIYGEYYGTREVFEGTQNPDGTMTLVMTSPNGSKVGFHSVGPWSIATAVDFRVIYFEDRFGSRTVAVHTNGDNAIDELVDPTGRWLRFTYVSGSVSRVDSSDGQWVKYNQNGIYAQYADGTKAYRTRTASGGSDFDTFRDVRALSGVRNVTYESRTQPGGAGEPSALVVWKETEADSGVLISRRDYSGFTSWNSPYTVSETRGDGTVRSFGIGSQGQITDQSDFLGNDTHYSGISLPHTLTDALGHSTQIEYTGDAMSLSKVTFPDGSYRQWTYTDMNAPYFVASHRDELGRVTTFDRLSNGVLRQITYPDGSTEEWGGHNAFNQPTFHRFRNGAYEWFEYDATGRLTRHWLPSFSGQTHAVNHTYYPDGHVWEDRLATVTDARGKVTSYEYDKLFVNGVQSATPCPGRGLAMKITNPDGTYRTFKYDPYGNKIWEDNELRQATTYTYDVYNRLLTRTDPLGRTTTTTYAHEGFSSNPLAHTLNQPRLIIHPSGNADAFLYDANFRLISETRGYLTPEAGETTFAYDAVGNRTRVTDPMGRITTFAFDVRNRMTHLYAPLGRTTQWQYDAVGNVTKVIAPDATYTRKQYDTMDRVRFAWDELNRLTQYTYHPDGQVHQIIDPRGSTHTHAYDAAGRIATRTYPGGSTESWTYDPAGNLATHTNRSNQILRYTHDDRNREVNRVWDNYAAPQVITSYDAASRLTWKWNWHGQIWYSYDAAGQLIAETQKIHGPTSTEDGRTISIDHTYDLDGRRVTFSSTAGTWIGYAHDARGLVKEVQQWGGSSPLTWATYTNNAAGERTRRTHYNGTYGVTLYDGAGRPTRRDHFKSNGSPIQTQQWGFDLRDRRTWLVRDGGYGDTYRYYADGQLRDHRQDVLRPDLNFWNPAAFTDTWNYDAAGNRTSWNENGTVTSYATNSLNQYTSVTGSAIAHDGRGNVTTWGSWTFAYDADNRLANATGPGHVFLLHYDPEGRLSKIVDNGVYHYRFYDGSRPFLRTTDTGSWIDFLIWGPAADELVSRWTSLTSTWMFHHQDGLNSTVATTNMGQNVTERYRYDAFGEIAIFDASWNPRTASAYGNRWCFTGQEWMPEIGLHNFKNRFYHADLGRFLQNDPIRFDGGDLNLYRYCFNDSINHVDPDGLSKLERRRWADDVGGPALEPPEFQPAAQKDASAKTLSIGKIRLATVSSGDFERDKIEMSGIGKKMGFQQQFDEGVQKLVDDGFDVSRFELRLIKNPNELQEFVDSGEGNLSALFIHGGTSPDGYQARFAFGRFHYEGEISDFMSYYNVPKRISVSSCIIGSYSIKEWFVEYDHRIRTFLKP